MCDANKHIVENGNAQENPPVQIFSPDGTVLFTFLIALA